MSSKPRDRRMTAKHAWRYPGSYSCAAGHVLTSTLQACGTSTAGHQVILHRDDAVHSLQLHVRFAATCARDNAARTRCRGDPPLLRRQRAHHAFDAIEQRAASFDSSWGLGSREGLWLRDREIHTQGQRPQLHRWFSQALHARCLMHNAKQ